MFTGLIETIGCIAQTRSFAGGTTFTVEAGLAGELRPGDSVGIDGVCLTAEAIEAGRSRFTVSAVTETLRRSTAGEWRVGRRVHLERALRATDRLGGHIVQGHVDGAGRVVRAGRVGRDFVLQVGVPISLRRYVAEKGSLAVDGVSLTVAAMSGGTARMHLIPETLARTLAAEYRPGRRVNLEVDIIAKYAESLLTGRRRPGEECGG